MNKRLPSPLFRRSWSKIIEFNAYIWLVAFVLGSLFAIIDSARPQVD